MSIGKLEWIEWIEEKTDRQSDLAFSENITDMEKIQACESIKYIENNGSLDRQAESTLSQKDTIELQRCKDIADKYLKALDFAKSISFLIKACNIQPSPENIELLNNAKVMKEEHECKIREKEELARKAAEDKRKLEEERQKLCQQILIANDLYEALGIEEGESDESVKKLIRKAFIKIHPDKVKVSNPEDFKVATQKLNDFKEEFERKIGINYTRITPRDWSNNQILSIEDEKSEESVEEFSNSDDSESSEEEGEFEEVQRRKRTKRSDLFESKPYQELEDFILNFNRDYLTTPPDPKIISDEFDDFEQYKEEFKAGFFLEMLEIVKKEINDIDKFKAFELILEEDETRGYIVSHKNDNLRKEFFDEVQANDLLLLFPYSGGRFRMSEEISNSDYWLGIARKDNKTGSIFIRTKQSAKSQSNFKIVSLGNLTTLRREFLTLTLIEESLLLDYILFPKPPRISSKSIVSERFLNTIRKKYNESQYDVLNRSFRMSEGISLVQGPPGTGKTSTILGLISGYLSTNPIIRPKILVCAPSNAAIDEIASRAHNNGLFDENGDPLQDITMLRIGQKRFKNELGIVENISSKNIPASVKEISLNYIIETMSYEEGLRDSTDEIKEKLIERNKLHDEINEMIENGKAKDTIYENLKRDLWQLQNDLNQLFDEKKSYTERQKSLKKIYIGQSDVIFCTSSTAGSADMMVAFSTDDNEISLRKFDYLIIDEACQSVELNILIPLLYDTSSVVLFGDPKQLPATTFADASKINRYNRSLFERIEDCELEPLMLKTQYRMITELSEYPSMYFYDHKLKSDPSVNRRQMPPGIKYRGLWFFDLLKSTEAKASDGHSFYNNLEAKFIVYELLGKKQLSIGIITPYRAQVELIKKLLWKRFGDKWRHRIEVDSVDGYQGREKDWIILSLVRSEKVGFLYDKRRMNVAITRTRFALNIVGNASCLRQNHDWDDLIDYCNNKIRLIISDYNGSKSWRRRKKGGKSNDGNTFKSINQKPKANVTVIPDSINKKTWKIKEKIEVPKLEYIDDYSMYWDEKWDGKSNYTNANSIAEEQKTNETIVPDPINKKKWKIKEKIEAPKLECIDAYSAYWEEKLDEKSNYSNINSISEEQKANSTIISESINKKNWKIKEKIEAPKLENKEASIDAGAICIQEEEIELIEAKILSIAINIDTNAINKPKYKKKKAEKTKNIPRADIAASEKSNALPKKNPKMQNASIGRGFWNRRK